MFKIIDYYRLSNLEDELERKETRILNAKSITRYDLLELEGLANEIQWLRYRLSKKGALND